MNRHLAIAAVLAGTSFLTSAPSMAHGNVQWSVTVGSPGYVQSPGVTVWPQPQYIYGPPPSAFAPPPVIYVQPAPVYRVYPPPVQYVDPYSRPHHRHEYRDRDRYDDGWRHRDERYDHQPQSGRFRR